MSKKAISYTLVYNRKKKLNGKGLAPIEVYLNKDGKKAYRTTAIDISPDQWNQEKGRIFKHPMSTELNNRLLSFIRSLSNKETAIQNKYGTCGVQDLLKEVDKVQAPNNFYEFAVSEINKENLSPDRKTKLLQYLKEFKEYSQDALITEIDYSLINDYMKHLSTKEYKGGKGNGVNYITKKMQPIKKYFKEAIKRELIPQSKNPFDNIKLKSERTNRTALSIEEIHQIECLSFEPSKRNYELIRDMFLFQFYTGMAFIDACNLSKDDITSTKDGLLIDNTLRHKTDKKMYLPLYALHPVPGKESKPEQLIRKYQESTKKSFFALPYGKDDKANNQYVNRILQTKIIPSTSIRKKVTTHVARHSFATFMIWKMPVPVVSQMLQHSKIETTMIYVHVTPENIIRELRKVDNWSAH